MSIWHMLRNQSGFVACKLLETKEIVSCSLSRLRSCKGHGKIQCVQLNLRLFPKWGQNSLCMRVALAHKVINSKFTLSPGSWTKLVKSSVNFHLSIYHNQPGQYNVSSLYWTQLYEVIRTYWVLTSAQCIVGYRHPWKSHQLYILN